MEAMIFFSVGNGSQDIFSVGIGSQDIFSVGIGSQDMFSVGIGSQGSYRKLFIRYFEKKLFLKKKNLGILKNN
jgi:hypothetical protein